MRKAVRMWCAGLALAAVAAGCGSSAPSAGTTTSAASTTTAPLPPLRSMLLTLADMPAGWTVVNDAGSTGKITGCSFHKLVRGAVGKASAGFGARSGFPQWRQELDAVAPGAAQRLLTGAITQVDNCHALQLPVSSTRTITAAVSPVSVPQVGDQSGAWSLAGRVGGVPFTFYVMFARFKSIVGIFFYGVLGGTGEAQFAALAARAGAKVESALGSPG